MKLAPLHYSIVLASLAMSFLSPFMARAADTGGYVRLDGGVNFADDPALDVAGIGAGKMRLDPGFRVDLAGGYDLKPWVGVELSAGYIYNSAESVQLGNLSVHMDDTWLQSVPLLGHVYVRYPNRTEFMPYLGAGGGGVVSTMSINRDSDTAIVFAYELAAGVIYKIDERAWIDFGYKYLGTGDPDYQIGGLNVKASKMRNHFIGVSVLWRF